MIAHLRELLEADWAGKGTWTFDAFCSAIRDGGGNIIYSPIGHPDGRLIVALHNCAEELLAVGEAAEELVARHDNAMQKGRMDYAGNCKCPTCATFRKTLRAPKEGKT